MPYFCSLSFSFSLVSFSVSSLESVVCVDMKTFALGSIWFKGLGGWDLGIKEQKGQEERDRIIHRTFFGLKVLYSLYREYCFRKLYYIILHNSIHFSNMTSKSK